MNIIARLSLAIWTGPSPSIIYLSSTNKLISSSVATIAAALPLILILTSPAVILTFKYRAVFSAKTVPFFGPVSISE